MVKVVVTDCKSYLPQHVDKAAARAMQELGGMRSFIKPGTKVLIKPNLLQGKHPKHAVTTHPAVVEAVIRLVKECKAYPSIGDSPGFSSLDKVAEAAEIKQLCLKHEIPLVELKTPKEARFPEAFVHRRMTVASELDAFDAIISLSKLKTHALTGMTGAVKNLFGCIPGLAKQRYHLTLQDSEHFSALLVDLARYLKPVLHIMDAVVSMEGNGPASGTVVKTGLIIVSPDPFALDAVAADISQLDCSYLRVAQTRGIKESFIENIQLTGSYERMRFASPKSDFMKHIPGFIRKGMRAYVTAKPSVNTELCTGCSTCMHACPAKAVEMRKTSTTKLKIDDKGNKVAEEKVDKSIPVFDAKRCVRCYCCLEICPASALSLKPTAMDRLAARMRRK